MVNENNLNELIRATNRMAILWAIHVSVVAATEVFVALDPPRESYTRELLIGSLCLQLLLIVTIITLSIVNWREFRALDRATRTNITRLEIRLFGVLAGACAFVLVVLRVFSLDSSSLGVASAGFGLIVLSGRLREFRNRED